MPAVKDVQVLLFQEAVPTEAFPTRDTERDVYVELHQSIISKAMTPHRSMSGSRPCLGLSWSIKV